jgi:transposase InsO family protein
LRQINLVGLNRRRATVALLGQCNSLANGRRFKCLTVADDISHECVDLVVDWGISGLYVTRLLDRAAIFRGYPLAVRTENGPEFTSRAFMAWDHSHGVRHILIEPGRPMQNGYIESFNEKVQGRVPKRAMVRDTAPGQIGNHRLAAGLQRGQAAQRRGPGGGRSTVFDLWPRSQASLPRKVIASLAQVP